jgi:hypothetical protein
MALVQDEDPIQTLGPDGTDEALRVSVSSWSPPRSANDLHSLGLEDLVEHATESLVPVMDENRRGVGLDSRSSDRFRAI